SPVATATETGSTPPSSAPVPRRHQRNPSITPTIGLRANSGRYASGTLNVLNPTGVAYSPNWSRNGMTNRMSRYRPGRAERQNPTPSEDGRDKTRNTGNISTWRGGRKPYQTISPKVMTPVIIRSARATATTDAGTMIRGK